MKTWNKLAVSLIAMLTTALVSGCSSNDEKNISTPEYNEYVTAYTTGSVTRRSDIQVIFSQDVPLTRLDSVKASDLMKITPKVNGTYTFADPHTLVFSPSEDFKRATKYSVKVDVASLFSDAKPFDFAFMTRPFTLSGGLKSFDVTDDDQYELTFSLLSADAESDKEVESHVNLSLEGSQSWTHASDGFSHLLKVRLNPTSDHHFQLKTVEDKAICSTEQTIATIDLPSTQHFALVDQRCKPGDSKCIEVIFNKRLDPKQEIQGLVYILGKSTQASVEGNKVYLQGDLSENESVNISISDKLRSRSGMNITPVENRRVTISSEKPNVEFVGDGTIIPQTDRIIVPFRSVRMRGVRVMVYRMFSNTMGDILQHSDINNCSMLNYAGRPIIATTFYIDGNDTKLSEWHNYAVDLTDLVKVEPGAMYRIELSLDARLSAWPSDSLPKASREEIAAEDAQLLQRGHERFDRAQYYYTGWAYDEDMWFEGYYQKRKDPSTIYYYNDRTVARNVLATNIGLTAQKGINNKIQVVAVNLLDARPMGNIQIEAYSMQRQLTGKGETSANGLASIAIDPAIGQPAYIVARSGDDVSYLKVSQDVALSTSTFDVEGQVVQRGLKGYIYGDRGVWRPGDTLHVAFMLNDRKHTLPDNHPVTLRLTNPLGQSVQRITRTQGVMGIYAFHLPTDPDAPTGHWNVEIGVGGVTFAKSLRIEAIKPNRLKIDLTLPEVLKAGKTSANLHTEWLNGNPASNLKYDIHATLIETRTGWKQWKGYVFDDPTKTFNMEEEKASSGQTDGKGDANCLLTFSPSGEAPGMLKAGITTHVYEPSGEFSVDVTQALVSTYNTYIGIKAPEQTRQSHLDTDQDHSYSVVSVDADGKAVPNVPVKVKVYKGHWYWWWSSDNDEIAGYTTSSHHEVFRTIDLMTDREGKASFKLNMTRGNWGTYLITAQNTENDGHSTGVLSYFDWPWMTSRRSAESSDGATILSINTDRKEYAPGDKIHLSFPSSEQSQAIVSISNGSHILYLEPHPCTKEHTEIALNVTEEMTPNVYIGVSLIQPYGQKGNDMPIRMYGVTPVTITSPLSHITPVISSSEEFLPESKVQVKVSERDGRPMGYTLAIVDEGLLDLTRFKTPDAWSTINAREALGVRFWDLYGHVSGAFGGRIEQLFSIGGDDALNNGPKAIVNRFTPMVYFAGPFELKKGETRSHTIQVPNYNGRVRIMAVAGDGEAYGSAEKSVLVRRPLMLIGTLPRQIGRGDEVTVSATVFATQALGEVKVSLSGSEGIEIIGNKSQSVRFTEAGDKTVQFRIREAGKNPTATLSIVASAGEHKADYTTRVNIRSVGLQVKKTYTETIAPGATLETKLDCPGNEERKLMVNISTSQPLNLSSRMSMLIAYPHGCVEQTTSKVFPQLFLSEFASLSPERVTEVENNVKYGITRLASYQTSDGGMAYWQGGTTSHPWASAYVLHFLSEASSHGYYVPEEMMRRLKLYVRGEAVKWSSTESDFLAAYQLYVLAAIQSAELGAMNRMREHASSLSNKSLQLLATAYALSGRKEVASELMSQSLKTTEKAESSWWIHESVTRLLAQMALEDVQMVATADEIRKRLMSDNWLSTSECATSLYAMSQFYKKNAPASGLDMEVKLEGETTSVKSEKYAWDGAKELSGAQGSLTIRNRSQSPIYYVATAQGLATQCHVDRSAQGLELSVSYLTDNGVPFNPSSLKQSTTFQAVVKMQNVSGKKVEHVAMTHILPAGWEVLSANPSGMLSYQDLRDDRVLSYIDQLKSGETITIRLNLSATYAGHYYLPAIQAEAMYDAAICGTTESGECEVK